MATTETPVETTSGTPVVEGLAPASSAEEAEIRKLLVDQGSLSDGTTETAAETADEGVFDDPEEAAAAAEMAAEGTEEETPAASAEETKAAPPAAAEEPDPNSPSIARGLQSLARKENQLNQREKVISTREKEFATKEAQYEAIIRKSIEDPHAYYRERGLSPADVAAIMYFQEHPQGAPPEVAAKTQTISMQRQLNELRREREVEMQRKQAAEVHNAAFNFMASVASTIPDELPYLKAEAVSDSRAVAQAMMLRLNQLRDSGQLEDVSGDEEIAAKVAKSLNTDIERNVKRIQKLHLKAGNGTVDPSQSNKPATTVAATKTPAPVAGEKKTAAKTITKKATAITRPPREGVSHQDDIEKAIAAVKNGTFQM